MKLELQSKAALDLAIDLAQLFHHEGYRWIEADNQLKPSWQTKSDHPLSVGEVVLTYLDPKKLIGVGFGQKTKYLLLDLDTLSKYHPQFDIDQYQSILNALESIGLVRYICLRSSDSDGRHVIFPLPEAVNTFQLAAAARVVLTNAGFDLQNGQLEIFPNTKQFAGKPGEYSHYKPHRLPVQPNSGSWLMEDDGLNPQPILVNTIAQLTAFLEQWEMAAARQDMELLNRKLPKLYETFKQRKRKYQAGSDEEKSAQAKKWEADLDLTTQVIGWTGYGETQILMPKFLTKGVVFLKLKGQALKDWMLRAIRTAPGYEQYCRHKHEIEKLVNSWADGNERSGYYSEYRSKPNREQAFMGRKQKSTKRQPHPANIRRSEEAKHRIRSAYAGVKELINATTTITELREMIRSKTQELFGLACSNDSLTKHKRIWHPKYNNDDLTAPNLSDNRDPELLQEQVISPSIDTSENTPSQAQTITASQFALAQIPMICSGFGNEEKINTPPYPREIDYNQKSNTPQTTGKFQVLAEALSKIAALAALVVGMVSAAGIEPEPSIAAEIAPAVEQTTTIETYVGDLPPCQNPRIPSIDLYPYNPNQNGVPWQSKQERDKFAGYLVITAKGDKSIANPYAWATKSLKNLQECGINSHWLNFTGQEMLDPASPQAELLRELFPAAAPPSANVTIHRSTEPIANVIEQSSNAQAVKTETSPADRQEQTAPTPPPNQPPTEQIANTRQAQEVRPQVVRSEHVREPRSISTPPSPMVKDNAQECNCPKCKIPTPATELERWSMCRFCATKILFKRTI